MERLRGLAPFVAMLGLFLAVQLLAVGLVAPFEQAGLQATEDPQDPANAALYVLMILAFTAVLLAAMRFDLDWVLKGAILLSVAALAYYVLVVFFPVAAAVAVALGIAALLELYPEWYVVDAAGVLMGAGAAGIFGISFGLLPALALLVALAVYDAIAVYRTEHMLSLADGAMALNLPVMFVVPRKRGYSFLEAGPEVGATGGAEDGGSDGGGDGGVDDGGGGDGDDDNDAADAGDAGGDADDATEGEVDGDRDGGAEPPSEGDRDAFFMGLGDAVIPGVLVASAARWIAVPAGAPFGANLAVVGALLGGVAGFAALMYLVAKGEPHAGLPLLNGGTIMGFLAGMLAMGRSPLAVIGL